jgi:molybdate transport system substrate-binding protein
MIPALKINASMSDIKDPTILALIKRHAPRTLWALVAAFFVLSAASKASVTPAASVTPRATVRTIKVFAAASLTDAFRQIGRRFEADHPGVSVKFSFGASNVLALQIREGAPVDLFASASQAPMDRLRSDLGGVPLVETPVVFAVNRLAVVVPRDNSARIRAFSEIARPGVKLVLAGPGVPAGEYARAALRRAGLLGPALKNLVSNEVNVRSVLSKVVMGEADAGIVYSSDARSRSGVISIEIPEPFNVTANYPVAVTKSAPERELARAFVAYLAGPGGQAILRSHGFVAAR